MSDKEDLGHDPKPKAGLGHVPRFGSCPPARYWQDEGDNVRCQLCPNLCLVAEGKAGRCLGRRNVDGKLIAASYGEVVSLAVDPIEKKPLYHFLPGTEILSVATFGCNLLCPFCQNSEISQKVALSRYIAPEQLVELAARERTPSIAFTYNEPTIWFEYVVDACGLARAGGLKTVLVTNGMLNPDPLAELLPLVDAMNIDLKSIRPAFYHDYVRGSLECVLDTIRAARNACHVELTNLLIPGRNDSEAEVRELVAFVASLGRDTVLHFSRYFPRHNATEPETPVATLARAAATAREQLDYVYVGNMSGGAEGRDTFCPNCRNLLIDRSAYVGRVVGVSEGKCGRCGRKADIVGA